MKHYFVHLSCLIGMLAASCSPTQIDPPKPLHPIPDANQLAWHRMEMNAFVHFSMNTFTGKEWGYGDESPSLFNPTSLDAGQWATVFKDTGFKGIILTCKHHDGFCLWPSSLTTHSVKQSPWKNGLGDVVGELAAAAKAQGLKFGIYLSPWDRNHKSYGTPGYLEYYRGQIHELFTAYPPVFEMWFDGANGGDGYYGGSREVRKIDGATYYQWPITLDLVREMSPGIIFFSDAGPGTRWVGNEKGMAGNTNWNLITPDSLYAGKPNIESLLNSGSENGTAWIPAETDVSIRPGWFYHMEQDSLVKSAEELFNIYLTSVGRGSTLLLNVPPDRRGLIHEKDVSSLRGFRKLLDHEFGRNHAIEAKVTTSNTRGQSTDYSQNLLVDQNQDTYWATDDEVTTARIELEWAEERQVSYIVLQEFIPLGQRVRSFNVELSKGDSVIEVASATTIGYKRILKIVPTMAKRIRVNFTSSKASLIISELAVY